MARSTCTTQTSSGSRARRRASARRWPGTARGPTPRSSASRAGEHPDFETVLLRPHRHGVVGRGRRAPDRAARDVPRRARRVHPQRAATTRGRAYMGEGDHATHVNEFIANCVAPIALGDHFLRAAAPAVDAGVDCGLVQMSSASARIVYPGLRDLRGRRRPRSSNGCAACGPSATTAGRARGSCAIRPGFVDTPGRAARSRAPAGHPPRRPRHRRGRAHREHAGRRRVRQLSGTRSPTTPRRSRCCSSASRSASPPSSATHRAAPPLQRWCPREGRTSRQPTRRSHARSRRGRGARRRPARPTRRTRRSSRARSTRQHGDGIAGLPRRPQGTSTSARPRRRCWSA